MIGQVTFAKLQNGGHLGGRATAGMGIGAMSLEAA